MRAHAINAGHKGVKATTKLSFGSATSVDVGGITLDVLASELRSADDGSGAHATALLVHTTGAHWTIGGHGINVQAVAHSNGTAGAFADASVNIKQNTVTIGGPVTVNAEAVANSHGGASAGAHATANLILNATTGDVSVGQNPFVFDTGSIFVKANAHNLGHNHANAQADASLVGNRSVRTENISVEAIAFDSDADGFFDTKANAKLLASGQGSEVAVGAVTVVALADRVDGTGEKGAVAIANAVTIGKSSNDMPVFSTGSIDINLHANYGVLVGAVAIFSNSLGAGHAQADANAHIVADTAAVDIAGAADVLGVAVDQGGSFANADADLKVDANTFASIGSGSLQLNIANHSGVFANLTLRDGIFVAAAAIDTGDGHVDAGADASVNANHNNITIHGGVDELALGITSNGSYANAQAHLLVNAFDNTLITGGSITANLFGCHFDFGSLLSGIGIGGPSIGVLEAAIAVDGGEGTSHHANALALANIDPNLVQINGDVIVAAAAFDNSGQGATASANLLINANRVHIGTESGHGNVAVVSLASENGTQFGGEVKAQANGKIVAHGSQSSAIVLNGVTVAAQAFDANATGSTVVANAHMLLSASNGGVRVGGINVAASATINDSGSSDAQANAVASINANRQINVNGDISVTAFANVTATDGDANAFAFLNMQAHNRIDVEGRILVSASAVDDADSSAIANASASINGNGITLNGGVDVEANARENSSSGTNALACANLNVHASTGSINITGPVTVNAAAELFSGANNASACAFANIDANDGQVVINGAVSVTANAFDDTSSGTDAQATASLNIHANGGNISLTGDVTVNAEAHNRGTESAFACANANIHADTGNVTVIGNIDVTANAQEDDSSGAGAHACANLDVGAFGGTHLQTINVLGDVTVNAQAQGSGSQSGEGGDSVTANARASFGGADRQDIKVNGNISVLANASYSGSNAQSALACANLDMDASSGNLTITGNVDVNAVAFTEGNASANANAKAELAAENDDFSGSNAGNVTVTGNITVTANAELDNSSSRGGGAHACANLDVDADSGNITLTGNINVNANARGNGSNGTESVTANAKTEIGDSSGSGTHGNIQVNGFITVTATADYTGDDSQDAIANANLKVVASSGFVTINGGINVTALATNEGDSGTARARTNVFVGAFGSPGNVTINGGVRTRAQAFQTDTSGSNASAWANMVISGSHSVLVTGPIAAHATATNQGDQNASAYADIEINAENVAAGDIQANARATHSGSHSGNATATAYINIQATRNIGIRGVRGSAIAQLPSSFASGNANAQTNIHLTAGSNISVGPDGLFGGGIALDSSGGRARANVEIAIDAGTNGVGNIFVRGNDIAVAKAIGNSTDNRAHANVHFAAGGATEFGTGAPSNFGNIVVLGNIGAFAVADATSDNATASVEMFAHNNILIVGNDPIASARVGPGSGTTFAFRQAHFTTNSTAFGPGGTAVADIDIRAGGSVTVVPTSSLSHILKLYAMPTDEPTLNSSGGLTIIPLSVDGDDCGVLGEAGLDATALAKAKACKRKPINVSDLTDTGP